MMPHTKLPQPEASYKTLFELFRSGEVSRCTKGADLGPKHKYDPQMLHFIGHGYIKVGTIAADGSEVVYLILGQGDVFPMLPIIGFETSGISFVPLTNVKLYSLPNDKVLTEITNSLELSNVMFEKTLNQYASAANGMVNLGYKRAYDRLVYRLLSLAARYGCKHGDAIRLHKVFTHKLIASSINATRETVTRELEKLRKKDLIHADKLGLVITAPEQLQDELESTLTPYLINQIKLKKQCRLHEK